MYDIEKTLFVTDLDGTLLRSDARISTFTADSVNECLRQGVKLAFATARSLHTAMKVVGQIDSCIPMILHNGAFIQRKSGEFLLKNIFDSASIKYIRSTLEKLKIPPIVYAIKGDKEFFSYVPETLTPEEIRFLETRRGDPRDNPISDENSLYDGEVFYISCLGRENILAKAYKEFDSRFTRIFQPDYYNGDFWLELLPGSSSKASAVLHLKKILGCEYIVAFGDAMNDISMFEVADESYAVANAVPELKAAATRIINSNDDDGVAKFMHEFILK
jgi:Cof subfamily protein (haloacid dehalogenase superfamily)